MEVCPKQRNHTFGSQIWKRSLGFARRHRQPLCRWVQEAQEQGAPAWALRSLSPPSTHGNNQHFFLVTGNMTGKRLAGSVHLLLVICIRLVFSPWCAKWRVNGCFTPGNLRSEDVVTLPGSLGKGQRWELKRVCVCVPVYFGVLLLQCHALPYIWSDRAESWLLECQAKQTFIYCVLSGHVYWLLSGHPQYTQSILQTLHFGWCRKSALGPQHMTVPSDVCSARGTELAGRFHLFLTMCCSLGLTLCWFPLSKD